MPFFCARIARARTFPNNLVGHEHDPHGVAGGDELGRQVEAGERSEQGGAVVDLHVVGAVLEGEGRELEFDDLTGIGRQVPVAGGGVPAVRDGLGVRGRGGGLGGRGGGEGGAHLCSVTTFPEPDIWVLP